MEDPFPQPVPGPELARLRKSVGVTQVELAARVGVTRINLGRWEKAAEVDALRAVRYRKALREIVAEAVA